MTEPRIDDWRPRVPIELEEAPAFFFLGRGREPFGQPSYTASNEDGSRSWEVTWSRKAGAPGGLAQRVLLALYALYEEQARNPEGYVYYSLRQLAEMIEVSPSAMLSKISAAILELEGVNIYVTGRPLADGGQTEDDLVVRRIEREDGKVRFLYRFLESGSFTQVEETHRGQLALFAGDTRVSYLSRRPTARARLSPYVVFALAHPKGMGRLVPSWVLPMRLPYAVRLTRLIGKRANGRPELAIRPERLLEFLPAIGVDGRVLSYREIRRRLEPAYELLAEVGFLRDVEMRDDGRLLFKLGREAMPERRRLNEEERAVIEEIVTALGDGAERNRAFYATCLKEGIGPEWMRGLLRECLARAGPASLAARYGRSLQNVREQLAAERGPSKKELEREERREYETEVRRRAQESLQQAQRGRRAAG